MKTDLPIRFVLCAGIAGTALFGPAFAQKVQENRVLNGQVQLGEVWANVNVQASRAKDVVGAATGTANTLTTHSTEESQSVTSNQENKGRAGASAVVVAERVDNDAAAAATAFGNALNSTVERGNVSFWTGQDNHGEIRGDVSLDISERAQNAYVSAAGVANGQAFSAPAGTVSGDTTQHNSGFTTANATLRGGTVEQSAVTTADAVANSLQTESRDGQWVAGTQISTSYSVEANSTTKLANATDAIGAANGIGNTISAWNGATEADLNATQENSAHIAGRTSLEAGTFTGIAAATSYGVGNSAIQGGGEGRAAFSLSQANDGGVEARSFVGGVGQGPNAIATASAAGAGNFAGVSAAGRIDAGFGQRNSGAVNTDARINVNSAATVAANASAIGNAASVQAGHKSD